MNDPQNFSLGHEMSRAQWPLVNVQLRNDPMAVRMVAPRCHNRVSFDGQSKGLLNGPGQNNCFLNCAVQVSLNCVVIFGLPRV